MNDHERNFVLNPVKRWQTRQWQQYIFMRKSGKATQGLCSRLCRQKTGQVRQEEARNGENLSALWINSTGIAQLTCYRKVCKGCYWPAWNLLHAEHMQLSALKCSNPQSPWWLSAELPPVYWSLSCTGSQYSRCSWTSLITQSPGCSCRMRCWPSLLADVLLVPTRTSRSYSAELLYSQSVSLQSLLLQVSTAAGTGLCISPWNPQGFCWPIPPFCLSRSP